MSTLNVTENYSDGSTLTQSHLNTAMASIETWANGNIDSTNIAAGGVTATCLDTGAVTAAKLASDAVTTVKILDSNVTTAKINDLAVTTGKINNLAVTTGKIAANAVTRAKLESFGMQTSSASGTFTTTSASFTQATNLSVSLTTTGRPVRLELICDTANVAQSCWVGNAAGQIAFFEDATQLTQSAVTASVLIPPGAFSHTYTPAAGTYTYTLRALSTSGGSVSVRNCKLIAFEY